MPTEFQQAYVAFSHRVREEFTGCRSPSIADHFEGLAPASGFELTEGAQVHGLVLELLDTPTMHTLINGLLSLLGQGFKVILSGAQLGGSIAHALAGKLLLQVR